MRVRAVFSITVLLIAVLAVAQQSSQQPMSPPTSAQAPMSMNQPSGQEPMVKSTENVAFKPIPNLPSCVTGVVERGDPRTGPYVAFVKETAGCTIPWHWHSASEQVMYVTGSGRLEMKGEPEQTVSQGSFAYIPSQHQHQLTCPNGCTYYVSRDGASDIHYIDTAGNEISPAKALAAIGEHTATPVTAQH